MTKGFLFGKLYKAGYCEKKTRASERIMEKTFRLKKGEALLLTDERERRYFTGFESSFGYVLLTSAGKYFYTDKRYLSAAKDALVKAGWVTEEYRGLAEIGARIAESGAKNLLIDYGVTTMKEYAEMKKLRVPFKDAEKRLTGLFAVKDKDEIAKIGKACEIAERAFYRVLESVREGISEKELANELEARMHEYGAEKTSFETIVAFGENSAVPHHRTGEKRLRRNMPVLMDFGCVYDGYCSDMTRTFYYGEPEEEFVDAYAAVLEANLTAEEKIRTGMDCAAADRIARDKLEECGYGKAFTHSLGHGIGTAIHEYPTIGPRGTGKLKSGMVFSVEPGVYFEGKYGIRIEDTVVLKGGVKRLMKDEKNLILID